MLWRVLRFSSHASLEAGVQTGGTMRRSRACLFCMLLLPVLVACSGPKPGQGGGPITVSVSPTAPNVSIFGTLQFSVSVTGTTNTAVTWQVNGVTGGSQATGYITSSGLFVAPGGVPVKPDGSGNVAPTTVLVTAVSVAKASASGSTTVTVNATPNQNAQSGAVELGTSGGNVNDIIGNACCGGTLGSLVARKGTQYVLSNNHVLAKSDFATIGDAVSQPGIIDVPLPNTCTTIGTRTVANLSEFYNLQTGALPKVDAAIAQVVSGSVDATGSILLLGGTQTNGVPDPAPPAAGNGVTAAQAFGAPHNGLVAKVGRTTGLTCSSIVTINFSASITYAQNCDGTGTTFPVNYTDMVQVTGGQFGAPGDSGSLIVTQDTAEGVALLVGGNEQDALGNAITDVLGFFTVNGGSPTTIVGGATHAVIGCTLPTKPASAVKTLSVAAPSAASLQNAANVRDAHGPELLAHPGVQAVGVGASYDNPAEATIVFFVTRGQPHSDLPQQVDGVRTRIVENEVFGVHGLVSATESAALEQSAAEPLVTYPISQAEVARAKVVQAAHQAELLKQQGVQGVGITSSVDSPGEAALMIYFVRGVEHSAVPAVIDGLRTRVRDGNLFRADFGGARPKRGCAVPPAKTTAKSAVSDSKPKP
jgi:hypothetical protein